MKQSAVPSLDQRAAQLVAAMTLEEKVSQMVYDAPAIERLAIPAYNWWNEGLHGVGRAGVATVFPQAIGLGATWNPELVRQVAAVISDEARAKHHEALRRNIHDIYTGLTYWSPNINIFRDPRWGRGQETYGEDPCLTAALGVAFIQGLQGDHPAYLKLAATPKHFAVHSGPETLRHSFDAQIDEREMREFYLFAFEASIREARAVSIMGAYNRVNGEPACASETLLVEILRREWGFEGYVVSDCEAIRDIYENHKVVDTVEEAAALAVRAGCDLNCGSDYPALVEAVRLGLIDEPTIDRAVTRLFQARLALGMFDPPAEVPYAGIPYEIVASPEHRALALKAARQSMVLLRNEGELLPLRKDIQSIAVIGPNAHDLLAQLGNYNGTPLIGSTLLEGIRGKVSPSTRVLHARGCAIAGGMPGFEVIPTEYLSPAGGEAGQGLSARYYANPEFKGEPALTRLDPTVDFIWKDTSPLSGQWGEKFSARWEGTLTPQHSGDYTIGVNGFSSYQLYLDGRMIAESSFSHHPMRDAMRVTLAAGQPYQLRLDLVNKGLDPQVQLLWACPQVDYEAEALQAAAQAEVVVMALGLSPYLEGEELPINPDVEGFHGGDRTDLGLPATQQALLEKVHALGKPVVLVLMNGSALGISWAAQHIPAIVETWYPGEAGGEALADLLFGDANPGGKLPVTFYHSADDLPPFEDYTLEGHTYRYFRGEPLYPFGYGLSYTRFALANLRVDDSELAQTGRLHLRVDVSNLGARAGEEVVQLYLRRPGLPASPICQLIGFQRVEVAPSQTRTLHFEVTAGQWGGYDESLRYRLPEDDIELLLGTSSRDLPLSARVALPPHMAGQPVEKAFFSKVRID